MDFDRMGCRVFYKEEVAGEVVTHHKFVYDNYLCVQKVDALNNNSQINLFVWDPTEPVATRPLFTTGSGNRKFFYACDGNKNVSEMVHFEQRNGIAAHYDYAPFGAVTRAISASTITDNTFTTDNPFRFSSEYHDDTLGLVCYNYRHYNPIDGRWLQYDFIENDWMNNYIFIGNNLNSYFDSLGLKTRCCDGAGMYNDKIECCVDKKILKKQKYVYYLFYGHSTSTIHKDVSAQIERQKSAGMAVFTVQVSCFAKSKNDLPTSTPDYAGGRSNTIISPGKRKSGRKAPAVTVSQAYDALINEFDNLLTHASKYKKCMSADAEFFASRLVPGDKSIRKFEEQLTILGFKSDEIVFRLNKREMEKRVPNSPSPKVRVRNSPKRASL
ncbi:MAG: RHS repeat-associated core domain-containing protein [Kiritimatiellae bacterium]|nr:RHS repeat-associated core domain-containing protein [Kiritimatiellia bacterium]